MGGRRGGDVGKKMQEEKRKWRDDWRTSVQGASCGWKTLRLKPPCNYILIMHIEGIVRSYHGPPLLIHNAGCWEPTQDRNNLLSPGRSDWLHERERRGGTVIQKWTKRNEWEESTNSDRQMHLDPWNFASNHTLSVKRRPIGQDGIIINAARRQRCGGEGD